MTKKELKNLEKQLDKELQKGGTYGKFSAVGRYGIVRKDK